MNYNIHVHVLMNNSLLLYYVLYVIYYIMYYRIRIKQNIQLVFLKVFTGCGFRERRQPLIHLGHIWAWEIVLVRPYMPQRNCRRLENHNRSMEKGFCLSPVYHIGRHTVRVRSFELFSASPAILNYSIWIRRFRLINSKTEQFTMRLGAKFLIPNS